MRKFIVVLFVLLMMSVGMSSAVFWDIQKLFTGRMMIPYGSTWTATDQLMYFGDNKEASIKFNSTSGQAEVVGMAAVDNLSIAMEAGEDITFAGGDSKFDIDAGTGITSTTSGVNSLNGNTYVTGTKTFMVVGGAATFGSTLRAASITSNATVAGADLTASDDGSITDDLLVGGIGKIGETFTANAIVDNTTLAVTGASTFSTVAVGVNASTVLSTTLIAASTKTVYDVDASGANRTLTLPDAATVDGRIYFISVAGNPGNNYVRITATGGDDINANNYLVSTDQWSNAWIVASNGAYRAVTSGTWTAHV